MDKKTIKCNGCNKELSLQDIGFVEEVELIYDLELSDNSYIEFNNTSVGDSDNGFFYCKQCNTEINTNTEELVNIFKQKGDDKKCLMKEKK